MMELLVALLLAGRDPSGARAAPVALVLQAGTGATVKRGTAGEAPLRDLDLLRLNDQVTAGKEAVTVVLLGDGHSERLRPGKTATLQRAGCQPAAAVEVLKRKLSKKNLDSLRVLHAGDRGGVAVLRRGQSDQVIRPPEGSGVLDGRPTFSWPAVSGAVQYDFQLFEGSGADRKVRWKTSSVKPEVALPETVPLPQDGRQYTWSVTAAMKRGRPRQVVHLASFTVLGKEDVKALKALKPLVAGSDPAGWLLAATLYESRGVHGEALALYEKAAKQRPGQANVLRALAQCYERLGLAEKADAAFEQAKKAGGKARKAE
jgi:hypothetical protein